MGKVRKGGKRGGERSRSTPNSVASRQKGQVLYCEKCCQSGAHTTVADVRRCYGRGVALGRDFRWVRA